MKIKFSPRILALFLASSFCLVSAHAEPAQGSEEKKKISGIKPMVTVKHTSLYKNSHIIASRGEHAIIPKRSILFLPASLKAKVVEKPTGEFILWPIFMKKNQNWIWTYEVTLDQAKGIAPLPEGKLEGFSKLNRLVVALFRGNPVSVLTPKKETDKDSKNAPNKDK